MKIISVVGARPNFMKIAPFIHAINSHNAKSDNLIEHILVHTGQHYDESMSSSFFKILSIPDADINLGIGSGTHAEQVGQTMIEFEKILRKEKPDWVVVVGDVNATLACSVTAKKEHINVCHIEAGLRSNDLYMPEEINRLVTDRLSDLLLTPDKLSIQNLLNEGVAIDKIKFVGNIMIDSLEKFKVKASNIQLTDIIERNKLTGKDNNSITEILDDQYGVITLHRPSNVDFIEVLEPLINFIILEVTTEIPIIWPIHPRTKNQLKSFGLLEKVENCERIILLQPIDYLDMLRLNMGAKMMLTDSGGLQEECTILGTPCLTMRWNTERPITLVEHGGVSILVGNHVDKIREAFNLVINKERKAERPELWDGQTAERCLDAILNYKY
jgi:UDP-N-acetylglucosamine 2-epimerase (non-hydrolysing)